jgi:hypothetical protein
MDSVRPLQYVRLIIEPTDGREPMSTQLKIVKDQLEAFRQRDFDTFMAFYTDDTIVKNFAGEIIVDGKEALAEMNRGIWATSPDAVLSADNFVVVGNYVVSEESFSGATTPGFPAEFTVGVVNEFRDELISGQIWLQ